jgi:hypothetical protein
MRWSLVRKAFYVMELNHMLRQREVIPQQTGTVRAGEIKAVDT